MLIALAVIVSLVSSDVEARVVAVTATCYAGTRDDRYALRLAIALPDGVDVIGADVVLGFEATAGGPFLPFPSEVRALRVQRERVTLYDDDEARERDVNVAHLELASPSESDDAPRVLAQDRPLRLLIMPRTGPPLVASFAAPRYAHACGMGAAFAVLFLGGGALVIGLGLATWLIVRRVRRRRLMPT